MDCVLAEVNDASTGDAIVITATTEMSNCSIIITFLYCMLNVRFGEQSLNVSGIPFIY